MLEEFCQRGLVVKEQSSYHYQYSIIDLFACFIGIHVPEEGPMCYCDFGLINEEEPEHIVELDDQEFDDWLWYVAKKSYVAFSRRVMRIASTTESDFDG